MGRPVFLTIIFLLAFMPVVNGSERPVKAAKKNARTHCRAKTVVTHYPVIKLKKMDSDDSKNHKKSKLRKHSFPV